MHVVKPVRPRSFVEIVNVLSAKVEVAALLHKPLLDLRKRIMRSVGPGVKRITSSLRIEPPDQRRVDLPRFRRGNLFYAMTVPQSA